MSLETLCGCLLVLASACVKNPSPDAGTPAAGTATQSTARTRDVITQDELQAANVASLSVLDAVKSLRPQFLTVRSTNSTYVPGTVDEEAGKVHASLDGTRVVPLNDLAAIRAGAVKEIRYLTAAQAQEKFGPAAHQGPVIVVTKV